MKPRELLVKIMVVLFALSALGCDSSLQKTANAVPNEKLTSVWVAYWDLEGSMDEIKALHDRTEGVSYFASYFDGNDELFIPEELAAFRKTVVSTYREAPWKSYLTFVNDIQLSQGSSLKDTQLLMRLFRTDAAIRKHVNQIVDMAVEGKFDGVEIDYEAMRSDITLWKRFAVFCETLYVAAQKKGLAVRVVLEPSAPLGELVFPEGPEYVMMCYNLYGTGTTHGPKADDEFLRNMTKAMERLPGKKTFALASGGYVWRAGSSGKQLTEADAVDIAATAGATVTRDKRSGALYFRYFDDDGKLCTVWYADSVTLDHWRSIIAESGDHGVMLWRLGGNILSLQ